MCFENIKNIIFDVGEVLFSYRWRDMLQDYGLSAGEAERLGLNMFEHSIWTEGLDGGLYDVETAIKEFAKVYPSDSEVISWFLRNGEQMVVYRPVIWQLVHQLKEKGYNIYILSNYSEELFSKHTENASFMQDIDGGVISYQVHVTKPDLIIYKELLSRYNLKPSECLFLDDRQENVDGAIKCGINAVRVTSETMLEEFLLQIINE